MIPHSSLFALIVSIYIFPPIFNGPEYLKIWIITSDSCRKLEKEFWNADNCKSVHIYYNAPLPLHSRETIFIYYIRKNVQHSSLYNLEFKIGIRNRSWEICIVHLLNKKKGGLLSPWMNEWIGFCLTLETVQPCTTNKGASFTSRLLGFLNIYTKKSSLYSFCVVAISTW